MKTDYLELDGIWHLVESWTLDLDGAIAACGLRVPGNPQTYQWEKAPAPLCSRCEPAVKMRAALHDAADTIIEAMDRQGGLG